MKSFSQAVRVSLRVIGVLLAVASVTFIDFKILHVNSPTAAFSFLLLILTLATRVGLRESIIASIGGMLAYNFFFLPPIGTFTIADPQNWVALFVFLVTAVTASHLSSSARRKAEEAAARERELQRMYDFSRALMLGDSSASLADQITQKISELFAVEEVAFYDRESDMARRITTSDSRLTDAVLREVAKTGTPWRNTETEGLVVPIRLGGPCLGSLGIARTSSLSEVALQAIAQLVAIASERTRAQGIADRAEAARQNEQLKSTLLDAFAHEFKTPLTSIKAAATSVLSRESLAEMEQDLLRVVDEEADHLNILVSEAIELARIGAGPLKLRRIRCYVDKVISSAMTHLQRFSQGRAIDVTIERSLPAVEIDFRLCEVALRQLLDNALKYSPPSSDIQITAEKQSDAIVIRVSNEGPGIPKGEQALIFEKFYRGRDVRVRIPGTGMGLAIAREIIEAHGGRLWLTSEPGKRVQFSFTVPMMLPREHTSDQHVQTAA
jgi:two-component system, OmpR family, sensor histidine kinase KdpD